MRYKFGITQKTTLVFVLFAVILLTSVGVLIFNKGRATLEEAVTAELVSTALEKQMAIDGWVEERQSDMVFLTKSPGLQDLLTQMTDSTPDTSPHQEFHDRIVLDLLPYTGAEGRFISLFIMHPESGRVLVSTNPIEEMRFKENRQYFISGRTGAFVQNPYFSLALNAPAMTVSAPINSAGGELIGVIAGRLKLEELEAIFNQRTGLHQSDDAYVINASNLLITQPRLAAEPAVLQLGVYSQAAKNCIAGGTGTLVEQQETGQPKITVYRWLDARQLCLMVEMDYQEVLAPARDFSAAITIVLGVILLGAILLAWWIAKKITRPILQLQAGAARLGQGDLAFRLPGNFKDEVGLLAKEFNVMAEALQQKETELREYAQELEKRVQERAAELKTLVENIPQKIFTKNRDSVYVSCNRNFALDIGILPEDLPGKTDYDFHPTPQADRYRVEDRRIIETGQPEQIEQKLLNNGEEIWIETIKTPIKDEQGNIGGVLGIYWDITDKKKAEDALRNQWEQFLAIINNFPEGLYVSDPNTYEVLFVNQVLKDALGSDPIGKKCYQAFQGFDSPCEFCTNEIIMNSNTPYTWEHHNDVIEKEYLITDQIIPWPDGRDVRFEVAIDISERKRTEIALKKTLDELERSNAELEQFAYVASHDLQEPLRMVASYTQLLAKRYKGQLDADADDFINYAVDGANRMQGLINDLLAFSRVKTHGKALEPVDCNELLGRVHINLRAAIEDNNAIITHDTLPVIIADPLQISQLFQNLIGNGIKFHSERSPQVHISAQQGDGEWIFSVRDNGIGFEEQYAEKIFIVFKRLHTKQEYPGTGIGLAICKRIVERHRGRIWVESQPGKGSTFYFAVPLEPM